MGRDVKAGMSFRYSIIVDSATNFRVWSLKVSGARIALRVTKLRKNRSRRGRPKPPREIEAVGLGRFSSSTSLAFISTRKVNVYRSRPLLPPLELSNRLICDKLFSRQARCTLRDEALVFRVVARMPNRLANSRENSCRGCSPLLFLWTISRRHRRTFRRSAAIQSHPANPGRHVTSAQTRARPRPAR